MRAQIDQMCGASVLRGMVTGIRDNGATVELAPGIDAWLPGEELSWMRRRAEVASVLRLRQSVDVVMLSRGVDDVEDSLRVSSKHAWKHNAVVAGKPWLFFGSKWSKVNALLEEFRREGRYATVEKVEQGDHETRILICADDHDTLRAVTLALGTMATANGCTLSRVSATRIGPINLSDLPRMQARDVRTVVSHATPTAPWAEAPVAAPAEQRGLFSKISAFFRRCFR